MGNRGPIAADAVSALLECAAFKNDLRPAGLAKMAGQATSMEQTGGLLPSSRGRLTAGDRGAFASRTRVRVKVCGITTPADAVLAADAGVDAIGINFFAGSPRAVSTDQAVAISTVLPAKVAVVGVFVDPSEATVREALGNARLDILQFHGHEPAAFCRQFDTPYVKAVGVEAGFDFDTWQRGYADARALMLDSSLGGRSGGTGVPFDWTLWPRSDRLLVLAGGLNPDNVAEAIRRTRPFAVDVASGVEGDTKGRKDPARLRGFLAAVADA